MTMAERLDRSGEDEIVDETNGFRLDFIKNTEIRFRSTTPDIGAVSWRRAGGPVIAYTALFLWPHLGMNFLALLRSSCNI